MISDIAFQAAIDFQLGRIGNAKQAFEEAIHRYEQARSQSPATLCSWCGADDDRPLVRPASGREAAICHGCLEALYRRQVLGETPQARIPSATEAEIVRTIEAMGAAGIAAHALPDEVRALLHREREERVVSNLMATTRDVTPQQEKIDAS